MSKFFPNAVRSGRMVFLFLFGLFCGTALLPVVAEEKSVSTAEFIDVDIEVWEIDRSDKDVGDVLEFSGCPAVMRMMLQSQKQPPSGKAGLKQLAQPTRSRYRGNADQLNQSDSSRLTSTMELGEGQSLSISLNPTRVDDNKIFLEYDMTRQTPQGEVKVSGKRVETLGDIVAQFIEPKSTDDARSNEKTWIVMLQSRVRSESGLDPVIKIDSRIEPNPLGIDFIPRPGRYEMTLSEGGTGTHVGHSQSTLFKMSGTTNVAASKDAKSDSHVPLSQFRAEQPVLEVVNSDDGVIQVVAVRPGVATFRWQVPGLDGKPAICELQLVVSTDTSEFDRVLKEVVSDAKIKVTSTRAGVFLTGTVESDEVMRQVVELAEQFYPKVINRLKVESPYRPIRRVTTQDSVSNPLTSPARSLPTEQGWKLKPSTIEPAAARVTPAAASEKTSSRPRLRKQAELKALHNEVRSLRDDVRRLSDLLEQRVAVKSPPQEVPIPPHPETDVQRPGKSSLKLGPNDLLFFNANWCVPCRQMRPIVDKLIGEGRAIKVIDIDEFSALAKEYNITAVPSFIRLADGKVRALQTGIIAEKELREFAGFPKMEEERLQRALDQKIEVSFSEIPLRDAIRTIARQIGANAVVDQVSLEEEGIKGSEPVSIQLGGVTARSALKLVLEPLHLDYVIDDEVIKVVSRQRAKGELTVMTYVVSDLLSVDTETKTSSDDERIDIGLKRIADVIRATISPDSWDQTGGVGSIRTYPKTCNLIVRQSRDVHEEIANLLDALRRLKEASNTGVNDAKAEAVPSNARKDRSNSQNTDAAFVTKTYAVADLVIPLPTMENPSPKPGTTDWLKLIDLITAKCDPDGWPSSGGTGSIQMHEPTLSLVIRNRPETHDKIAEVLAALRREQDVQVVTDVRLFEVADVDELKKAGLEIVLDPRTGSMKLDADAARKLGETVRAKMVSAPKITLFNGQIATVSTGEILAADASGPGRKSFLELHVRGVVSPDRRSVGLSVALNPQNLVNDLVRQSQSVPDGGFLLVDLTGDPKTNAAAGPSLRKFALVQTRILIQEEEEELLAPPRP